MRELWLIFKLEEKEIAAYTLRGTFPGEAAETKALLAAEYGCSVQDIKTEVVRR